MVHFKPTDLTFLGRVSINVLESLGLLAVNRNIGEDKQYMECNNFTVVNLVLKFFGPMHERSTTVIILLIQVKIIQPSF